MTNPYLPKNLKAPLTPREVQICEHLLEALTIAEIAKELGVGINNVKNRMYRICRKLDVQQGGIPRVRIAVRVHEWRHILGVRCVCDYSPSQACGEC